MANDTPISDVVMDLHEIEKDSYLSLIDTAIENSKSTTVRFTMLSDFMGDKINRQTAVFDAFNEKHQNTDILNDYSIFRGTLQNISGKNDDLDKLNGLVSQAVYGDVRMQRRRKRDIAILVDKQSSVILEILDKFDKFKTDAEDLKNTISPSENA